MILSDTIGRNFMPVTLKGQRDKYKILSIGKKDFTGKKLVIKADKKIDLLRVRKALRS